MIEGPDKRLVNEDNSERQTLFSRLKKAIEKERDLQTVFTKCKSEYDQISPDHPNNVKRNDAFFFFVPGETSLMIKMFRSGLGENRINNEAKVTQALSGSNLEGKPTLLFSSINYEYPMLVFPFYESNAAELLSKISIPEPAELQVFISKIGEVIVALHEDQLGIGQPVAWGDVKPGNVLFPSRSWGGAVAYDFGDTSLNKPSDYPDGLLRASMGYIPFEHYIFQDYARWNLFQQDQYGFATMIYRLISSNFPFGKSQGRLINLRPHEEYIDVLRSMGKTSYLPLSNQTINGFEDEMLQKLDYVLSKAVALHPKDRYLNFKSFFKELIECFP